MNTFLNVLWTSLNVLQLDVSSLNTHHFTWVLPSKCFAKASFPVGCGSWAVSLRRWDCATARCGASKPVEVFVQMTCQFEQDQGRKFLRNPTKIWSQIASRVVASKLTRQCDSCPVHGLSHEERHKIDHVPPRRFATTLCTLQRHCHSGYFLTLQLYVSITFSTWRDMKSMQ